MDIERMVKDGHREDGHRLMEKKRKVDEKEKQSRKSDIGSILINKSSRKKGKITRKSLDIEVLNQEEQIGS